MTGRLTTHVLDTASGSPASNLKISLFKVSGDSLTPIKTIETNHDGRADAPLLEGDDFKTGTYELQFDVGAYFSRSETNPFLGVVPVRFGIANPDQHYHVPLLVSPFGYSTYRGS